MSSERESAQDSGRSVRSSRLRWAHPFADVFDDAPDHRNTVLHAGLGSQPEDLKQCAAANRVLESLGDPRILQARAVTRLEDGRLSLTTDAAPGLQAIGNFIGRPARLSWIIHVLLETCGALDAAHGLGVFHGALGGGNVLVGDEPERPTVKVTDFGVAHMFSADRAGSGPAQWQPLAPEHMMGHHAGPATDVYLVGALAFALLAGRPVFRGDAVSVVVRRHAIEEPPMLHRIQLPVRVPRALSRIILRCLVKEVEDRFDGPADLADALRGHMARSWEEDGPSEASGPIGRSAAVGTSLSATPPTRRATPSVERPSPTTRTPTPREPAKPVAVAAPTPEPEPTKAVTAPTPEPEPTKAVAAPTPEPEPAKPVAVAAPPKSEPEPAKAVAAPPPKSEPAKPRAPAFPARPESAKPTLAAPPATKPAPAKIELAPAKSDAAVAKPKAIASLPKPKAGARKPEKEAAPAAAEPAPSKPAATPVEPPPKTEERSTPAPITDLRSRLGKAGPAKLPAPGAKLRAAAEAAPKHDPAKASSAKPIAAPEPPAAEPPKVEAKPTPDKVISPSDTAEISLASVEVIDEGEELSTADFDVDVARAAKAELEPVRARAEPSEQLAVSSSASATKSPRKWIVPAAAGLGAVALAVVLIANIGDDEPPKTTVAATRSATPTKAADPQPPIKADPASPDMEVGVAKPEPEPTPEPEVDPVAEPEPEVAVDPVIAEPEPEPELADEPTGSQGPSRAQQARALSRDASDARRTGDTEKAMRLYRRALSLRPGYAPAASGLAFIHFNRGEYDKAAQYGRLAVRSSPGTPDYLLRLGDTYFKMNRKGEAKAQWERAARLGSDVAKKRLAKL